MWYFCVIVLIISFVFLFYALFDIIGYPEDTVKQKITYVLGYISLLIGWSFFASTIPVPRPF